MSNSSQVLLLLKASNGMAYLISKMVFAGFIAAWFFADSPIKRSSSVKETKDGVVKLPCSFATGKQHVSSSPHFRSVQRTDFDICSLVISDT